MERPMSANEEMPKTSIKDDLTPLCSCYECDTIRCYTSKKSTNHNDDDKVSKTCIFFTNITLKKSNINADTSTCDISQSEKDKDNFPCGTCTRENEIINNNTTNYFNPAPKSNTNTTKPVCKICKRGIEIDNVVSEQVKTIADKINNEPKSATGTESQCRKNSKHVKNVVCKEHVTNNIIKEPRDKINRKASEVCRQNINKDVVYSKLMDIMSTKNSVCEGCLKNIKKIQNAVSINKETTQIEKKTFDVCGRNDKNQIGENKSYPTEHTQSKKVKCESGFQAKLNNYTLQINPKENIFNKNPDIHDNLNITKLTSIEKISMGKSRCTICGQETETSLDSVRKRIEKCYKRKLTCKDYVQNICPHGRIDAAINDIHKCMCKKNNWENNEINTEPYNRIDADNSEIIPSETKFNCSKCKINIHGQLDAIPRKIIEKFSCSNCGKDVETYEITETASTETVTEIDSKCSCCTKNCESRSAVNIFEDHIKCTKKFDTFRTNATSFPVPRNVCSSDIKSAATNRCNYPPCTMEVTNDTSISSIKSLLPCDSKYYGNLSKTYVSSATKIDAPVTEVHNALIDYIYKDLHLGTAKLSAQIMNLPYEEFEESYNIINQDIPITKNKMKTNLSNEILKRIKDVYRACSCKVCECIAGKSLNLDRVCDCKPCECEDCKLFQNFSNTSKSNCLYKKKPKEMDLGVSKRIMNQLCDCKPCDCIKCMPPRTYITARVSESHQANNCSCSTCHCLECERNFFSLSSHLTHEMSTGMTRSCGCEQCLDQRCRGAGGTDDCRCEMPSKAIFKPVEKDSYDYDIRRASVYPKYNSKYNHDTIAMYASVSSNYPTLGTLTEACSCEECECIACRNEGEKLPVETISKPQLESHSKFAERNSCICKSCECEICSDENKYGKLNDPKCVCDVCDCINCQKMTKLSTGPKLGHISKSIGRISYNNCVVDSYDCNNANFPLTGSSQENKLNQKVCINATFDNNRFMENCNSRQKDESNKSIFANTYNIFHNLDDKILPPCDIAYCDKNYHNDFSMGFKTLNKIPIYLNYADKEEVVKKYERFNLDSEEEKDIRETTHNSENAAGPFFSTKYPKECLKMEMCPFSSNHEARSSITTLETCLTDILKLSDELKENSFKISSDINKSKVICDTSTYESHDITNYGHNIELFSGLTKSIHKQYYNGVNIPTITHNTCQLKKLLEKYDKANKDFQGIAKQLKPSHELNICSKLDMNNRQFEYLIIEDQSNSYDNYSSEYTVNGKNDESNNISEKACINHTPISNKIISADSDWKTKQNEHIQKIHLLSKGPDQKENIINTDYANNTDTNDSRDQNLESTKSEHKPNLISSELQQNEKRNMYLFEKSNGVTKSDLVLNNNVAETSNSQKIDILTAQLSDVIKENVIKQYVETASIHGSRCTRSFEMSEDLYILKSEENYVPSSKDWSVNKKNFYLSNYQDHGSSDGLPLHKKIAKLETQPISVQVSTDLLVIDKTEVNKMDKVRSAASLPRNKTTHVDKESDTNDLEVTLIDENEKQKPKNKAKSAELDILRFSKVTHSSRTFEITKPKCRCDDLKVESLSGRRVSDHTVMVKWNKPKNIEGVQGYELLIDGRPVQKIIDSSRCVAVVTCLPNCDKILLSMRTIIEGALKSGHKPTVTIVYRPRLKRIRNEQSQ
ncbi:uncharacterized protein LOC106137330 isoform X2 [Amyelois transitella]|uniref:uncharacterized protein LOC106137330 isoform X2 n=1 Tax=Amyelois transitella TaxID=680683 RepID=UPI00298FE60C|nr:uncharacterized protein LOC106137330 isoform X2 [Amyelois transitella]